MSIAYSKITSAVALTSSQLAGTDQATLEASYLAKTLDGSEIPATAFKDKILAIEKELVGVISSDNQHPYRSDFYGVSGVLADKSLLPTESIGGVEFIGVFGGVFDSDDDTVLTEQPVQIIEDLSAPFFADTEFYHFAFTGSRIRHTRPSVYLEGCIWSLADQTALYATGDSPLPQSLENTWIAGVLANLAQASGWFVNEAGYYAQVYANGIQMLKMRSLDALPSNIANVASGVS